MKQFFLLIVLLSSLQEAAWFLKFSKTLFELRKKAVPGLCFMAFAEVRFLLAKTTG